ncbi:MAG: DMT family transporter [Proteobacteria bacterium]|nr:DMT family transporter [Pseudomonadota bacterium]
MSGILLLVSALFLFSIQDVAIKYFSDQYSVLLIVFIRGVIATSLMLLAVRMIKTPISLISQRPFLAIARGLLGFTSYTTYYLAVASLPLAQVVAIVFTAPLFVTAMSALLLGEKVGLRRWSAVFTGFIGVLIIVGPSGEFTSLPVLLAFAAAITYGSHTIITRYLSWHDNPLSIAFNTTIVFTLAAGLLSLLLASGIIVVTSQHPSLVFLAREWSLPEPYDLGLMIFLGFNGALAFYWLSKAYCVAPASVIAPFEYTYIVWAIIFGYLFWSEIPSSSTLTGVLVLISSSIYIWHRERRLLQVIGNNSPTSSRKTRRVYPESR